jgi:Rad3-related DNA helicase
MIFCAKCGTRMKTGIRGFARCPKCGSTEQLKKAVLTESFPFRSMRPFQEDVLKQIDQALASSKRFILLEAPVGFGKSAVAAALCKHLQSAYLLTSTKQLQDQYSADFSFPPVIGKSNFTCCVPTSSGSHVACSKGRCEADWTLEQCPHFISFDDYDLHKRGRHTKNSKCEHLKDDRMCPYYMQKWDAFRAKVAVANYSFFLSELRYTDDVRKRKLLVCDEAHDLEKHLVGFASYSLRRSMLESYRGTSEAWSPSMPSGGDVDAGAWIEVLRRSNELLDSFIEMRMENPDMQDKVATARGAQRSLEGFIEELKKDPENWVVNKVRRMVGIDGGDSVEEVIFQPLEVGSYTKQLFESAETILLMSATLSSGELFSRTFGIPPDQSCFIRVRDSTFPVENRPIRAMDVAHLSRTSMDSSLERIAQAVDSIMDNHATERGVVHTTSYQQANFIIQHVSETNRARLVSTEGSSNRSSLLKTHSWTDASVLISPSLYQGVDLKDDLSRFQVVVKVPFPDLSERRTQVKLERDPAWYAWQTALRLVQTYGRSVRSETDHATTYILDSNFTNFIAKNSDLFPRYFLDAIEVRVVA